MFVSFVRIGQVIRMSEGQKINLWRG